MKNLLKLTLIIVLLVGVYFLSQVIFKSDISPTTYQKLDNQITSHTSTPEELTKINQNKSMPRSPASSNDKITTPVPRNWEVTLSNELLKFQENHTKVIIQDLEVLTLVENDQIRSAQKVIITYLHPDNHQSSATALVDVQNGKIIKVWNRTKHEHLNPKSSGLTPANL